MKRKHVFIFMALILGVSLIARFAGLKEKGLAISDEGFYLNGAKTYYAVISYAYKKAVHQPIGQPFTEYLYARGGTYPCSVKPAIYLLILPFFFIFGIHDYASLFLSASAGTASVFLMYLIGKEIYGKKAGLIAALLLSVSAYHINYSRNGLSVSASIFFILLGFYLYIRSAREDVLAEKRFARQGLCLMSAAASLAAALGCHYNLLWFFPFLLCADWLNVITRKIALRRQIARSAVSVISYAAVFSIFVLPFAVAQRVTSGLISKTSGVQYHIQGYVEQMREMIQTKGGLSFTLNDPLYYIKLLGILENPFLLLFAAIGVLCMLNSLRKKVAPPELIVLLLCIGPITLWSFYPFRGGRTIAVLMPFFALSAACALDCMNKAVLKNSRFKPVITVFLLACITFLGLYKSAPVIAAKSGLRSAIGYMGQMGNVRHISNNPDLSVFYVGNGNTNACYELTPDEAVSLYKDKGYRFFLSFAGRGEIAFRGKFLYERIRKNNVKPVFVAHSSPYYSLFECDEIGSRQQIEKDATIEVYELGDIL